MGLSSLLARVYDVDTLDTRLTNPSKVPYQTVIDGRSSLVETSALKNSIKAESKPPKWRTPEFMIYYTLLGIIMPYVFYVAYEMSSPSHPQYLKYSSSLSPGWIPGRRIDLTDAQYSTFRQNLAAMGSLLIFHPLLRRVWNTFYKPAGRGALRGSNRLNQRASFDFVFAFAFLFVLYGFSAAKILALLTLNYQVATKVPKRYVVLATWVFNIGSLFANARFSGYRVAIVGPYFLSSDSVLLRWGIAIDEWTGILGRWEILYNLTVLRLISFNIDCHWRTDKHHDGALRKQPDPANLSEKDRITTAADGQDFSFRNYIAYVAYAPLYLAGPIMTFNDYISQSKFRPASIEVPRTIAYAVRFFITLLAMEVVLHINYVSVISKVSPVWSDYTAAQLSILSYFNLHIIWLKLLLPWRLFRLWALVDGLDAPENMLRCVTDNISTQQFWRSWHRSYHQWLVRYIYIPLGGLSFRTWRSTARSTVTYLLIFTFVALWHDIELNLLIWGWLIVLFMIPEWTAAYLFPPKNWQNRPKEYRMLCGIGSVLNILMMMAANLVGFAVGLDGLRGIIHGIVHQWSGCLFLLTACGTLFMAVQIMFEVREAERRRGLNLKC